MRAWLDSQHDWLRVERLPAYAPELNAVEYLWANLKDVELANLPTTTTTTTTTLAEVADAATQGIQRVCKTENLAVGSSPRPACPSTHEPSTQPTKLNNRTYAVGRR
jgi:hypothetical protein